MGRLIRLFNHQNSNEYIKELQNIATNYNNTKHSSTGFKPNEINEENSPIAFRALYNDVITPKDPVIPKFHLNQMVYISLNKQPFEKGI